MIAIYNAHLAYGKRKPEDTLAGLQLVCDVVKDLVTETRNLKDSQLPVVSDLENSV